MPKLTRSQRAHALRAFLFGELGAVCALCGATEDLQFDFIKSDGGKHHSLSHPDRQRAYLIEHTRKNLRVLCGKCNRAEGLNHSGKRALFRAIHVSVSESR